MDDKDKSAEKKSAGKVRQGGAVHLKLGSWETPSTPPNT
jgi:hypothetical protein